MEFTVEKSALLSVALLAEKGVPKGASSLPVLTSILLNADKGTGRVMARGTDLDLGVKASCDANVASSGSVCVNAKLFTSIIKALSDGAVSVRLDDKKSTVTVESGASTFDVQSISANEFPKEISFTESDELSIDAESFVTGMKRILPASSNDPSRPILCGVNLKSPEKGVLRAAATDSYRLAVVDIPIEGIQISNDKGVTIHSKTLLELVGAIKDEDQIGVIITDTVVRFRIGDVVFSTRLIEGDYPGYEKLMATDNNYEAHLPADIADTLKRVQVVSDSKASTPAKLEFIDGELSVSCSRMDVGNADETIPATFVNHTDETDGERLGVDEPFTVGVNIKYALDGVNAFGGTDITMRISSGLKPILITGEEDTGLQYVLMPVRL